MHDLQNGARWAAANVGVVTLLIERRAGVAERIVHPDRNFSIDVRAGVFEVDERRIVLWRVGADVVDQVEIF